MAKKKRVNGKKKPNNITKSKERRISKIGKKKPLSPNGRNNGPQAYKIVKKYPKKQKNKKQTGPREPKEGSSKPMETIRNRKQEKMGQRSPKK